METRHFIKTLCEQKVFLKHSYRIKRQVGTTLNSSDPGISNVVKIAIGMDRYLTVGDCALCIIYLITYACIVGLLCGKVSRLFALSSL